MVKQLFQQLYLPHPALKEFVNNIIIHEAKFEATETQATFSVPPLPEHFLMFFVRDRPDTEVAAVKNKEKVPSSMVVGPNTNRHIMTPRPNHLMIKVGFQPGGLYRFLRIPMIELACKDAFNGTDLFGNEIDDVNDQLRHAASYVEMKGIVERFLLNRARKLKEMLPIDQVLPLLIKEGGLLKIDQLASFSCLSIRQFERAFKQRIGLPPKHFSRMVRFAQAWIMKE